MAFTPDAGSHFQECVSITTATTTAVIAAKTSWKAPGDNTTWQGTLTSSGSATSVTDSAQSWTVNALAGYKFYIRSGTYAGESAVIASNTSDTLTLVGSGVAHAPSGDETYDIWIPEGYVPVVRSIVISCSGATAGKLIIESTDTANVNTDMPIFEIPTGGAQLAVTNVLFAGIVNGNVQARSTTAMTVSVAIEGDYVKTTSRYAQ